MTDKSSVTTRIILGLILGIVVTLVIVIPFGYFLISYNNVSGSLEAEAEEDAKSISQLIGKDPDMWMYEQVRLSELLSHRYREGGAVSRRIVNVRNNEIIAESSQLLPPPVAMRSADLWDSGVVVARIGIYRSIRPLLARTGVAALLGSCIGFVIYITLRMLPLRAVRQAEEAMSRINSELNTRVQEHTAEILERRKAATEVVKVNRALRVLGKCNEAIVRAIDYESFLNKICRIIIEDGKYLMAWIGYPQTDGERTVLPVACAGHEDGYLSNIKITCVDNEWGRGPTGTAIRTKAVCVQNDMFNDPEYAPWRNEATRRGYASSIGLPLIAAGECFGALTIYAPGRDIFVEEETRLLKELADNVAFGLTTLQMRAKKRLAEEQLRISHDQLHNLAAHLQSIKEEERTNIARDIHDELGQALTAMKMDLSWVRDNYGDNKPIFDKTNSILDALNATILSVKRICTELRPWLLDDFGLVAAMEWQANEFEKRTGIECTVIEEPWDIELDKELSTVLFRIFQEALTNVLKHAKATKVTASLLRDEDHVILEVMDNGKGITDEQISKPQSFGLIGMRERVYPWRGEVEITGDMNRGTTVKVTVPLFPLKPSTAI